MSSFSTSNGNGNGSSSNSNSDGNKSDKMKRMEQSMVTAALFVPQEHRDMNDRPATVVFTPTHALPTFHEACAMGRKTLCPTVVITNVPPNSNNITNGINAKNTATTVTGPVPLRSLAFDTHFAIEHRKRQLHQQQQQQQQHKPPPSRSNSTTSTASTEEGAARLPHVDNISDLQSYCETFERLLREEREEVLLLYERYSQYHHRIDFPPRAMLNLRGRGRGNITSESSYKLDTYDPLRYREVQEQRYRCKTTIKGIADAKPPIQVGDIFLARPTCPIRLPHNPQQPNFILRHAEIIEVQAQVSAVVRQHEGNDKVVATWLNSNIHGLLYQRYRAELAIVNKKNIDQQTPHYALACTQFHIRLVPNPKLLVRCLTALTWLAATCPPKLAMELLFPTSAPNLPDDDDDDNDNFRDSTNMDEKKGDFSNHNGDVDSNSMSLLNDKQASFVRMVLRRTRHPDYHQVRAPLVLTGPAGTGKTKTLLCAIRQVLACNNPIKINSNASPPITTMRILVCTPSHTAADVVTKRLGQFLDRTQLFRLLDPDRPIATVPTAVLQFCRQNDESGDFCLPKIEELLNFHVIVCTCEDAHLLYLLGLTNHQLRLHRQELQRQTIQSFAECGVVVDSIPGVDAPHFTHLFIDEAAQATEPETLIPLSVVVDPTSSSSTNANGASRKVEIALVGDPRQLQPRVYCSAAARAGLERSWMERLLRRPVGCLGGGHAHMLGPEMIQMDEFLRYSFQRDGLEHLSSFLTLNYRGHPSFLAMPSALFYADKLQSADYYHHKQLRKELDNVAAAAAAAGETESNSNPESGGEAYWCAKLREIEGLALPVIASMATTAVANRETPGGSELANNIALLRPKKQFTFPIHFRGVLGSDVSVTIESGFTGESWTNPAEADVVTEIVEKLIANGVGSQSIGVMAPFRGQVVLIRRLLRAKNLHNVNVGTIEDYQGVERDTIILSLTRATQSFVANDRDHRFGVFGQPKRSNVAMTRAENLLVVVGNPNVMAEDHVWRQWLWFCLRNGLWYGATGDTEHLCKCNPSRLRLVRHYPHTHAPPPPPSRSQPQSSGVELYKKGSSPSQIRHDDDVEDPTTTREQLVAISSLERLLRPSIV